MIVDVYPRANLKTRVMPHRKKTTDDPRMRDHSHIQDTQA
jgi:hypothetical protein